MKKYITLLVLICVSSSYAQLNNIINKTPAELAKIVDGQTDSDAAYWESHAYLYIQNIVDRLQADFLQANDYATLSAAISAASTDTLSVMVSSRYNITTNTTLSGQTAIIARQGARFNISSGDTLTINIPFYAGLYKIFEGSGVVQFADGSASNINIEWFGSTDIAVNKAIQSLTPSGGSVQFSSPIVISDSILIDKPNVHFHGIGNSGGDIGVNIPSSYINISSGSSDGIVVTGSHCLLENFTIDGLAAKNGDDGIRLESNSTLKNIQVLRMGGNGIRMGQDSNNMNGWVLQNITTFNNDSNGVFINDSGILPDVNTGVAFFLHAKGNGLDGLRIDNALDNQFYMYRGDFNSGYGIRLSSGAKGNFFSFPYLESNTTGTGIIESGALQNFIFGTRQGTSDSWIVNETNNDNIVLGRDNSFNDRYIFKGNISFKSLFTDSSAVFGITGFNSKNHTVTINSGAGGVSNGLIINNPAATVSSRGSKIQFQNDGVTVAEINYIGDGTSQSDGKIRFQTMLSNSLSDKMTIDKNGKMNVFGRIVGDTLSIPTNIPISPQFGDVFVKQDSLFFWNADSSAYFGIKMTKR